MKKINPNIQLHKTRLLKDNHSSLPLYFFLAGMDDLPLYYDPSDTMYHILEDNDSGVGADDLPFTAYSGTLYEPENPMSSSNQSYQTVFVNSMGNQGKNSCHDDDDGDDEDENDLEYVDDDQDYDYRPNKNAIAKKVSC